MGRRLGQHFLKGTWAARKLVSAAGITKNDTVLEIGPGEGALTKELLAVAGKVIAIEKDEALVEKLKSTFGVEIASGAFILIAGDIRDFDPEAVGLAAGAYILAANIPYYITGEIIRTFLSEKNQPCTMALLVQKEVAERIISDKESILSLSVKAYGTPAIAAKVTRGNFSPPPAVDSAILVVRDISKRFFTGISEQDFFKAVRAGFSSKRKMLLGNLVAHGYDKDTVMRAFVECGISEKARAETVGIDSWKQLVTRLVV